MEIKIKYYQLKIYLDEIKPELSDIINDHKTKGQSKIHLTIVITFFYSKDSEETCTMYKSTMYKSDDLEVVMGKETDKTIEDLFDSFLQRYQKSLEESQ